MAEVKSDDICLDNKESAAASSSSVSENSSSILLKSPGISSPSTSPAHRYSLVIYSVYIYIYIIHGYYVYFGMNICSE